MATATKARPKKASAAKKKNLTIDVHAHIRVPQIMDFIRKNPIKAKGPGTEDWFGKSVANLANRDKQNWGKLTDPKHRIGVMNKMGIDVEAISSNFPVTAYWAPGPKGLEAARIMNNGIAEYIDYNRDRFVGIGCAPLQAPKLAAKELERMVKELDFRAVWIASNVRGKEIGKPEFRPFWEKAEELDLPVFVHPLGATDTSRLQDYYLWNTLAQPLEELMAMSSLIFEGIMDDYPKLKVVICHGGGFLPYYGGRADQAWGIHPEARGKSTMPPSGYLKRFYYDSIVFEPDMLGWLVKKAGASHIMMGTDYPHGEKDPIGFVKRTKGLSPAQRQQIIAGTAQRLLKIR